MIQINWGGTKNALHLRYVPMLHVPPGPERLLLSAQLDDFHLIIERDLSSTCRRFPCAFFCVPQLDKIYFISNVIAARSLTLLIEGGITPAAKE